MLTREEKSCWSASQPGDSPLWLLQASTRRNDGRYQLRGRERQGGPFKVCNECRLVYKMGNFGKTFKGPTLWVYTEQDDFFEPG